MPVLGEHKQILRAVGIGAVDACLTASELVFEGGNRLGALPETEGARAHVRGEQHVRLLDQELAGAVPLPVPGHVGEVLIGGDHEQVAALERGAVLREELRDLVVGDDRLGHPDLQIGAVSERRVLGLQAGSELP